MSPNCGPQLINTKGHDLNMVYPNGIPQTYYDDQSQSQRLINGHGENQMAFGLSKQHLGEAIYDNVNSSSDLVIHNLDHHRTSHTPFYPNGDQLLCA